MALALPPPPPPAPAKLAISPASFNFGSLTVGQSQAHSFSVSNSGGKPATAVAISGSGAFAVSAGSCGGNLGPGASCAFSVTFHPTAAGAQSGAVSLHYNNGSASASASVSLQGNAVAPLTPAELQVSGGSSHNYGSVTVGSSVSASFTVHNAGQKPASAVAVSASGPFSVTSNGCGNSVAAGGSCTVQVRFAPASAGAASGAFEIAYNNGSSGQSVSVSLSGTGVAPVAPASLEISGSGSFGSVTVGSSGSRTLSVKNTGGKAAAIQSVSAGAPFAVTSQCGSSVAAGASCALQVTFSPSSAGAANGSVTLHYNNGATSQSASLALSGTGVAQVVPAVLQIAPVTFDFGQVKVGAVPSHGFSVKNTGGTAAALQSVGASAPFAATSQCGSVLAAGATCQIQVTFAPSAAGSVSSALVVKYQDGAHNQSVSVSLAGTGIVPASPAVLTFVNGSSFAFGGITVGTSTSHNLDVKNTGGKTASLQSIAAAAPFAVDSQSCGNSLAAGASCSIQVRFSPGVVGAVNGSLQILYHDGVNNQVAKLPVSGTGLAVQAPAVLTISDGPTFAFGQVAINGFGAHDFWVKNSGQLPASVQSIGAGAPFSVLSHNCGANVSPGKACRVRIAFQPMGVGDYQGQLSISYQDGVSPQTANVGLTGTGYVPATALLAISEAPAFDFGVPVVGSSTVHVFTVYNYGTAQASQVTPNTDAPFSLTASTCGAAIPAGGNCALTVTFSPQAAGPVSDSLSVTYENGQGSQTASVALTGLGLTPAQLSISDGPTFDYGVVALGGSSAKAFTVSNSGQGVALLQTPTTTQAPFAVTGNSCGSSLAANASCVITVTFSPAGPGPANDTLTLAFNDTVNAFSVSRAIQGTGATPAQLAVAEAPSFDFGNVAQSTSAAHTFTLNNSGQTGGSLQSVNVTGSGYALQTNGCNGVLASGGSCNFSVTLNVSSPGSYPGTIALTYFDGVATQTISVGLTGTAVAAPVLSFSDGQAYDFGAVVVGGSQSRTETISNLGQASATGFSPSASGSITTTGGTCTDTLDAGASCTVVVTFSPAAEGPTTGSLSVAFNDGLNNRVVGIGFTGTGGRPAALALSDVPTFDFGAVASGGNATHAFTVSNSGGVAATLSAPSLNGAPFSVTSGCGTQIAASASCAVSVTFSPSATGVFNDSLTVPYNDGLQNHSISVALQGTGAGPAIVGISDGASFDFGTVAVASAGLHTFTVTNSGQVAAGIRSVTLPAGAFTVDSQTCGNQLAAAATCTVAIRFAPVAAGSAQAALQLAYFDGAAEQTVSVSLTGNATLAAINQPSFDGTVESVAVAPDGGLWVGGEFTHYGQAGVGHIAKLKADGTLDATFAAGSGTGFDDSVLALAAIPGSTDVYAGGRFQYYNGNSDANRATYLVRLHADGTPSADFNTAGGLNGAVSALALAGDGSGKVYAVGAFTTYQGNRAVSAVRLGVDGSWDSGFNTPSDLNGAAGALALESDTTGAVLHVDLTGDFSLADGGGGYGHFVRLGPDGSADTTFVVTLDKAASALALDASGKLLLGGSFTQLNGGAVGGLVRLNADATIDSTFTPDPGISAVTSLAPVPGNAGLLLVGGGLGLATGATVTRLKSDGTVDTTFSLGRGFDNTVTLIVPMADGSVYIGGSFGALNGVSVDRLVWVSGAGTLN
jgi:hypothetical protein